MRSYLAHTAQSFFGYLLILFAVLTAALPAYSAECLEDQVSLEEIKSTAAEVGVKIVDVTSIKPQLLSQLDVTNPVPGSKLYVGIGPVTSLLLAGDDNGCILAMASGSSRTMAAALQAVEGIDG